MQPCGIRKEQCISGSIATGQAQWHQLPLKLLANNTSSFFSFPPPLRASSVSCKAIFSFSQNSPCLWFAKTVVAALRRHPPEDNTQAQTEPHPEDTKSYILRIRCPRRAEAPKKRRKECDILKDPIKQGVGRIMIRTGERKVLMHWGRREKRRRPAGE